MRTTYPVTTKLDSYIPWSCLSPDKILEEFCWKFSSGVFFHCFRWVLFKVKHSFGHSWSNWHETKRKWIGWILGQLCDLDIWPHPWPWSEHFKVKFWDSSAIGGLMDVKQKGSKSFGHWTMWTFCVTTPMILNFNFQGQHLKKPSPRNAWVDRHGMKVMWVYHSWLWHWTLNFFCDHDGADFFIHDYDIELCVTMMGLVDE